MRDAKLSAGGAVVSAFGAAASWLCCLPFALGALGTAGTAVSHFLGPIQPFIAGLSVLLIGVAFVQTYRPVKETADCALDGECSSPIRRAGHKRFLWIAAAFTLALVSVPYWLNWVIFWSL